MRSTKVAHPCRGFSRLDFLHFLVAFETGLILGFVFGWFLWGVSHP